MTNEVRVCFCQASRLRVARENPSRRSAKGKRAEFALPSAGLQSQIRFDSYGLSGVVRNEVCHAACSGELSA